MAQNAILTSLTGRRWKQRDTRVQTGSDVATWLRDIRELRDDAPAGFSVELLADFSKAAERIARAIEKKEAMMIFGDYDCDGITSTTILARYFHRRNLRPNLRLPHRLKEGYGLKMPVIEECIAQGVTLLMTVDTGIGARKEIAAARAKGIDVIVFDHHHIPDQLPEDALLLHPGLLKNSDALPCAAGLVWSVVRELEGKLWEGEEIDTALAAIGTVADLVELRDGNRALVNIGLKKLEKIVVGPLALFKLQAGLEGTLTSRDIAFRIAPRINAAGRMADPTIALNALLGNQQAIFELESHNQDRQQLVRELMEKALLKAEKEQLVFPCLIGKEYAPGICGLIAGRLTEALGKPSLVAYQAEDGACVGSLRSISGYHVTEGLERARASFVNFGGHAAAAGCSFEADKWPSIVAALNDDLRARVDVSELLPTLNVDAELRPDALSLELIERLTALEPFGQGNPEPVFTISNVRLTDVRRVGKDGSHLQARLGRHKLIGFGFGEHASTLAEHVCDIACHVGIDSWNGKTGVQLFLQDARTA